MKRTQLLFMFFLLFALPASWAQFGSYFPNGTEITGSDGDTAYVFCPGDGSEDFLRFRLSNKNALFAYVITTPDGTIINVSTKNFFDFEQLPEGEYRVYAFVYLGKILAEPGGNIFDDPLASVFYELTNNFISVSNITPDGGQVTTTDGETAVFACPGDGSPDLLFFATTSPNTPYTYLITDENNVILDVAPTGNYDFENSMPGTCRVWGLSYAGTLLAQVGDTADQVQLASECFSLSETFVEVVKTVPEGGRVTLLNGDTLARVCAGDGVPDFFEFATTSAADTRYSFLLATEDDNLFIQLAGNALDFDVLPAGTWKMYGVSWVGNFIAQSGDNLFTTDLADGCFELSENFVELQVEEIPESTVSLSDGSLFQTFCADDGNLDLIQLIDDYTGNLYAYLLTDEDNNLLESNFLGNFNLTGRPAGTYRAWGVGFSGSFLAQPGDNVETDPLASGCFRLSDNFAELTIEDIDGGTVSLQGGGTEAFLCPAGPQAKVLRFDSSGATGTDFAYLVTNADSLIVEVLPTADSLDFDGFFPGTYQVYGLGYTGNLLATFGIPITEPLSDQCFGLSSNTIPVFLQEPEGGTIATETGETEVLICPGDTLADFVDYVLSGDSAGATAFLITDTTNRILEITDSTAFDFNNSPVGYCRIWGLTYTGNLLAAPGQNAGTTMLSDDCFDLTDNFITVARFQPDGGTVATADGDTVFSFCPALGNANFIRLSNTSSTPTPYAYLVTDTNNVVLATTQADSFDLKAIMVSPLRIWGLSYTGTFNPNIGGQADTSLFSNDCFDLSGNFIAVEEAAPFGGNVSLVGGDTSIALCVGDGLPDELAFDNDGNPDINYAYLITDEQGIILATTTTDRFDFEGAGGGTCLVYGLSYAGNLTASPGQNVLQDTLADDCFDLSDNRIEVIRNGVDGGQIATDLGDDVVYICPGDGVPDFLSFTNNSSEPGADYLYLIATEDNVLLGTILPTDSLNFENLGQIRRVYGISYTGNFLGTAGDVIGVDSLSDACYGLSTNFITVISDAPAGGTIATEDGQDAVLDLCLGGSEAVLSMTNTSASLAGYLYVITDTLGNILAVSDDDKLDFNPVDGDQFLIYGISYTGDVSELVGKNIQEDDLANSCFELSGNFIVVNIQDTLDGGTLTNGNGGANPVYSCPGDGVSDIVLVEVSTTTPDDNYRIVVTDENDIVQFPNVVNPILNFDDANPGIYRIWGLAYTGTLNIGTGTDLQNDQLSDSCTVLSGNFITVINQLPEGGSVALSDSVTTDTTIVVADGQADNLSFTNNSTTQQRYRYVVTGPNDAIQFIIPLGNASFDFENTAEGENRIYGLSYTGNIIAGLGDTITQVALSDECFDLSDNFIRVVKTLTPGQVSRAAAGAAEDARPVVVAPAAANGQLRLAPNPVTDLLNVNLRVPPRSAEASAQLVVFNAAGQLVKRQNLALTAGENQFSLEVYDLQPGLYVLHLQHGGNRYISRFLKN